MQKLRKILAMVLVACMILTMIPAMGVAAADEPAAPFMEITSGNNRYLSTVGSNAFNVFMYDNTFSGVFGDQHMAGIEFSLNGTRIATNGDLHLLPTPEQWDATPAPSRGNKTFDTATNTITVPMTFSGSPDGTLRYDLIASPTADGMKLQMILRSDMPEALKGKARFNLEFLPAAYKSKTFQADLNGDGIYDDFGVFPLAPQDAMVETERADLPSQEWYVKEWNEDRGNAQPVPFATGKGFVFSPEDAKTRIAIEAVSDSTLELLDGRNRAQNGWYVLSSIITATKAGETAIEWNVTPSVEDGWVREPNVGFSQVGYTPLQEKFAVAELDKWDEDYPKTMSLWRINADGSEEMVLEKALGATSNWMRFKYARFDFTEVKETGLYCLHYGDQVSEVFPIAKTVYDNIWQSSLSGFMAVQMDHIVVREGYKIWHGASHMDDAYIAPTNRSWFDGMNPGSLPQTAREKGFTNDMHVDGLNKGGWFDAGDFDLQMNTNFTVLTNIVQAAEYCDNVDNYDTLAVTWNDATGGLVEMHRPDGVPDAIQQAIHGSKQILAQYKVLGGCGGTMEVRSLRQYTHLGDPSSDTDGWIYDSSLAEDEIVERDGKVYSGRDDDRYILFGGGGGSFSTNMWSRVSDLAGTAALAAPYYPEYAQELMNACIEIWQKQNNTTSWGQNVQFMLAARAMEKANIEYDQDDTLNYAYFKGLVKNGIQSALNGGLNSNMNLLALRKIIAEEGEESFGVTNFEGTLAASAKSMANSQSVNNQPYGVNFTSGSGWGGSPNTYQGMRNAAMVYYNYPEPGFEQNILRSVNYMLGRHPATNSSWISGVGTKSAVHPYNSNRADESFIPGSILPGHITFGDYVESMDDFNFLWFENESIVSYQSSWIPVGLAATKIAAEQEKREAEKPAPSKDFDSNLDLKLKRVGNDGYFTDKGFDVFMYSTVFDRGFGDQHCAGIELLQNGRRVATNGDIHLLPTPEQWDATPAPIRGERTYADDKITVRMTIPEETFEDDTPSNPAVDYDLIAEPEEGGLKLTCKLTAPLPADLIGKAGFNMEFLPSVYIAKSIQADADGDGTYDHFSTFPLTPFDDLEDVDRARTNNQTWFVKEWNEQRGNGQAVAIAEGKKMVFAAEDDDYRIRIESEDGLTLHDGRNRAQNGWFVLRTLIPEGATEVVWHISPDTQEGWTREPNLSHSQAGYEPELSKVSVIELDPNYVGSDSAKLLRLEADGTYTEAFEGELGAVSLWKRYAYRDFDFTSVKQPGTYVIEYDGFRSDPFPIKKHAYANSWQSALSGFLAVEMDHMRLREGYKIWNNPAHMDDGLQAPLNTPWFDYPGRGITTKPEEYEEFEHIGPMALGEGLAVGGWVDAGDNDIQVSRNIGVINDLAMAYNVFGIEYDTLAIDWDLKDVEMHRPDGDNDLQQQIKHGVINLLAQLDVLGFIASCYELPSLRQYTHIGDKSKGTDGRIYDPTLGEDEVRGIFSGKRDDRYIFDTYNARTNLSAAVSLAAASQALRGYDEETADKALAAAEAVYAKDNGSTNFELNMELYLATGKEVYKTAVESLFDANVTNANASSFGRTGYKAGRLAAKLGGEYETKYTNAVKGYAGTVVNKNNPYGVADSNGMWGGVDSVVRAGQAVAVMHKFRPDDIAADFVFRAANYVLGQHPYNSTSWLTGVGKRSLEKTYGINRGERFYVAGGIAPGYVTIAPDLPEQLDDFNYLWFENEAVINTSSMWVTVGYAAEEFARESDVPCEHDWQSKVTEPTCTKGGYTTRFCNICFESETVDPTEALGHDFDDGVITKQPTAMFDGVKTFTCHRCGTTYKEAVPKVGGNVDMSDIDFTDPASENRFNIENQDVSAIREGEGLYMITTKDGFEPANNQLSGDAATTPKDLVLVPVAGDWTATLEFDFSTAGASNGYYQFFGFYAMEDVDNAACIRGGDGAMQDFIRLDGAITHETETSEPGLAANGTYWYRIVKVGTTYTCYRSEDGISFTKMFAYENTGIEAQNICIDAYTGMTEGYEFLVKSLSFDKDVTHEHNYTAVVTEPTCTEAGYTTYTCACGDTYVADEVAALGHSWDNGVVTKQATATESGIRTYTCTRCGETRTEVIPAIGDLSYEDVLKAAQKDAEDAQAAAEAAEKQAEQDKKAAEDAQAAADKAQADADAAQKAADEAKADANADKAAVEAAQKAADEAQAAADKAQADADAAQKALDESKAKAEELVKASELSADKYDALADLINAAVELDISDFDETQIAAFDKLIADSVAAIWAAKDAAAVDAALAAALEALKAGFPGHIDITFEDMPAEDNWAYAGIAYCVYNGYMNGVSETKFAPSGDLTRGQLVTILYRIAGEPEMETKVNFSDVPEGKFYSAAINWAAQTGVVNGYPDGTFRPEAKITREQIATILYRFAGSPEVTGNLNAYPDSAKVSAYAHDAMIWATSNGLITGIATQDGVILSPKTNASRAQIATLIMRYLEAAEA